jgi:isopenicillin-N epimerase
MTSQPQHRQKSLRSNWRLDPEVAFLNHGSFGACPQAVLDVQTEVRNRMEREPADFFIRKLPGLLAEAREALGRFLGADSDDLAYVPNVTVAVNSVLQSLEFSEGDEILVTNHAYNACRNVVDYVAQRSGSKVVEVTIPFPLASEQVMLESIISAVGPRTRLAMLDHVTSPTGLVCPINELVDLLRARDVTVLVDGAHAPGMLELDLRSLDADFYAGNCHKWMCAPKGAGFLHVSPELRERTRPAIISHAANADVSEVERFRLAFEWTGTRDPTPWLSVPAAISVVGGMLAGGWDEVMLHNRTLALEGRALVASALGVALPCPDTMIGSLATLEVPHSDRLPPPAHGSALALDPLQEALFRDFKVEVPVLGSPAAEGRLIRISAQLYNERRDYERLAEGLTALL